MFKTATITAAILLTACDPTGVESTIVPADEARSRPPRRDTDLAIGEDVQGTFVHDLQRDSYLFTAPAGAVLEAEVELVGTQRGLDTRLFVYGPADEIGNFSSTPIASDDDSGVGRLSKISSLGIPADGDYRITITTKDGRQRGTYRLELLCVSGACIDPQ